MTNNYAFSRTFPPNRISDLNVRSAHNLIELINNANSGITLVLGAGVSASAMIPSWNELLIRMCSAFFEHWLFNIEHKRGQIQEPPINLSICFKEKSLISDKAKILGNTLATKDLLLAAQQIKNCIRETDWIYLLRHVLYEPINFKPQSSSLIDALVKLCVNHRELLRAVISYNYDDLFELAIRDQGLKTCRIFYTFPIKVASDSLPIIYPHGIVPIRGGYSSPIILAEMDYHQESAEPYSGTNMIQLRYFTTSTCMFVGTSITDPNHRRLLRIAANSQSPPHYCFLKSDKVGTMYDSLFDYDIRRIGVQTIRYPESKSNDPFARLPQLIKLLDKCLMDKDYLWE